MSKLSVFEPPSKPSTNSQSGTEDTNKAKFIDDLTEWTWNQFRKSIEDWLEDEAEAHEFEDHNAAERWKERVREKLEEYKGVVSQIVVDYAEKVFDAGDDKATDGGDHEMMDDDA